MGLENTKVIVDFGDSILTIDPIFNINVSDRGEIITNTYEKLRDSEVTVSGIGKYSKKENKEMKNALVEGLKDKDRTLVHTSDFIIGSKNKLFGVWSVSERPTIHHNYQDALTESKRLARAFPEKKFIVLAVVAVSEIADEVVPVNTTYRL